MDDEKLSPLLTVLYLVLLILLVSTVAHGAYTAIWGDSILHFNKTGPLRVSSRGDDPFGFWLEVTLRVVVGGFLLAVVSLVLYRHFCHESIVPGQSDRGGGKRR